MMQTPQWLSETAKRFWKQHAKHVALTEANKETFAVLCETYASYRAAEEYQQRKTWQQEYVRLAKLFGLVGTAAKHEDQADELEALLND